MRVGGNLVYGHTEKLNTRIVNDWYDYFYADFGHINNFVLYDIPPYSNGIIKLTFTSVSTVEIGAIIVGKSVYLGKVTTSSSSDEVNNSRIDIKETGESILLPRKSAPKMNTSNVAEAHHLNKIRQVRKELSGVPAVWSGLDDKKHNPYFDAFLILGVFKQFYIKDPVQSHFQIDFEIVEIL